MEKKEEQKIIEWNDESWFNSDFEITKYSFCTSKAFGTSFYLFIIIIRTNLLFHFEYSPTCSETHSELFINQGKNRSRSQKNFQMSFVFIIHRFFPVSDIPLNDSCNRQKYYVHQFSGWYNWPSKAAVSENLMNICVEIAEHLYTPFIKWKLN